MEDLTEIRIHGRGGMGVITAAKIIAEAALSTNKHIQAFPDYGPERSGAPVRAYVKISQNEIKSFAPIKHAEIILVLDPTLMCDEIIDAVAKNSVLIINTHKSPEQIKKIYNFKGTIHTIDATGISLDLIKKDIPNTAIIGALIKTTNLFPLSILNKTLEDSLKDKLSKETIKANLEVAERGYNEVK